MNKKDFNFIKQVCIKIWGKYSDEFGYRSEKINRVRSMDNLEDWYFMLAMFDYENLKEAYKLIMEEINRRQDKGLKTENLELVIKTIKKQVAPFY